jgi:acylphosphatase
MKTKTTTQKLLFFLFSGIITLNYANAQVQVQTLTSSIIKTKANYTLPTCFGQSDGGIAVVANGGVAPYSYLWNNGTTAQTLFNIGAGSYSLIITDAVGNSSNATFNLNEPNQIQITGIVNNAPNASINISASGGTPQYTYIWGIVSGANNISTQEDLTNIAGGSYSVMVSDANGCKNFQEFSIQTTPVLNNFQKNAVIYPNPSNGETYFKSNVGIVKYEIYNSNGTLIKTLETDSFMINELSTQLNTGNYTVLSYDMDGVVQSDKLVVNQ